MKKLIKLFLLIFIGLLSMNSFAQKPVEFSGEISFTQVTVVDTFNYKYFVKDNMVTLSILINKDIDEFMIFDLSKKRIIAANSSTKTFKEIYIKPLSLNIFEDTLFKVKKYKEDTIINNYKCKKWVVINNKENTKIIYYVNNYYNYSFFTNLLSLLGNRMEKVGLYFLHIKNTNGYFPIKTIEIDNSVNKIIMINNTIDISKDNTIEYKNISNSNISSEFNLLRYKNFIEAFVSNQLKKQLIEKEKQEIIQKQKDLSLKNELLIKDKKIKEKEIKEAKTQKYILIGIVFFIILLTILIILFLIRTKKANKTLNSQKEQIIEANEELNQQNEEITAQRDEIEKQKEIVEEIHHEISQSIDYATRLQGAILPEEKILEKYVSEHFVLFKPKDKVSGDFYWWSHVENHTIITGADSTGHGVPGAFMSMLGSSFLREIVQKEYVTHTGVILRKLRKEIIKALKQKGEQGEQKDGMDMAIISIDHKTNMVQFSGANNPLYILTNRELDKLEPLKDFENFYEIKPDKMPIAIYEKMDNFTTHEIQLEKGDQLYMFSDGFADQFGGPKGKKFKYRPFKRLFFENKDKPMNEQKELLNLAFEAWKGDLEQIDDVVVLGIKI